MLPAIVTGGGHGWRTVALGAESSCAIDTHGALYCWGENDQGQLGDTSGGAVTTPTRVCL